jgi:hypothetical protein
MHAMKCLALLLVVIALSSTGTGTAHTHTSHTHTRTHTHTLTLAHIAAPQKGLSREVKTFEGLNIHPDALFRVARFRRELHQGAFSLNVRAFNK